MNITIEKLNYSNYNIPCTENKLKHILNCSYDEALILSEDEIYQRISILQEIMKNNEMDYNINECYAVANMENNYHFALQKLN